MALLETFIAEPPPLRLDAGGTVRVGPTRVTLDTVIGAWLDGATAEEIVQSYDTLKLADIHAVISYYLHHRREVDDYLEQRRQDAAEIRRENERRFPPDPALRERLLARQSQREQS